MGILILQRLRHLPVKGYCMTSEAELAKHGGCSVVTVKRYLARLRNTGFIVENRGQDCFGRWQANKYVILLSGQQFLKHFESSPQLADAPQVSSREKINTSSQPVSYGEIEERTVAGRVYFFVKPPMQNELKDRAQLRQRPTSISHSEFTKTLENVRLSV